MKSEPSPFQLQQLDNLAEYDDYYRTQLKQSKADFEKQRKEHLADLTFQRATLAHKAVSAGLPKSLVYRVGLHTSDAETLNKLLEANGFLDGTETA